MSEKSAKKKKRNPLLIIAALFVVSGLLRFGSGAGKAIAEEIEGYVGSDESVLAPSCKPNAGISQLLAELSVREDRVKKDEMALRNRMLALEVAEEKYSESLKTLIAAENALSATISRANSASETDLAQLTSMYENMKPKDAAALFEEMDPGFSSGFLGRMRPDAAAAVLAGLKPETAYAISVILAGRNASVPKDDL